MLEARYRGKIADISASFELCPFVQCHLLNGLDIAEELREILEEDDLEIVLRAEHRPNCLIQLMTQSVKSIKFEGGERSSLVRKRTPFSNSFILLHLGNQNSNIPSADLTYQNLS